ncbi:MAG: nucleotide sugar dehydrogenase [Verrucomicrobia bacterium]|nr:nucleotide sugar dehydrogenase [Verrucomicrobiota bacterium]
MKISIFGLGYVGAVISGCFAKGGHQIIGVDTDQTKVDLINSGKSPIIETGLDELISEGTISGTIRATTDSEAAVRDSDITMICVGTPSRNTGDLDLAFISRVCEDIGRAMAKKDSRHIVVARSTMLPGSMSGTVIPALEKASGKRAGEEFGIAINPEFLRESTAIYDFYNPPKTVIGALLPQDSEMVAGLYAGLPGPMIHTKIETAEMVKYVDNVFHALKITFANEIGSICKTLGIDSHEVMGIFCQDKKLNLSPAYLKPGFAFGGSCLPKDLRALNRLARARDVAVPMLNGIGQSNDQQIAAAVQLIREKGKRRIGILGFAFKAGTDDLRESPVVTLAENLLGKGFELKLYDPHVSLAHLIGANRRYIEHHIPHISRLMVNSIAEVVQHAEVLIIGNQNEDYFKSLAGLVSDQHVIDLTANSKRPETAATYERVSG